MQCSAPADFGRLLQRAIESCHCRGQDEIGDGQVQETLDQDHPRQGVDVDRDVFEPGDLTQEQVDQAVGRVQQEHPADREQDVRDHHRDDGDDPEQKFEGNVRACIQIGQEKRQAGGHHRGPEYENDRVDDDPGQFGVGVCLDVLVRGEFAKGSQARGKASEDQHDYGTHGQETDDGDQGRRQDRSFVDHCSFPSYLVTSRQWSGSTVKLAVSLTLMSESGSVLMKSWLSLIVISPSNASPMKTSDWICPLKTFCAWVALPRFRRMNSGRRQSVTLSPGFMSTCLRQMTLPMAQSTVVTEPSWEVTVASIRLVRPMKSATKRWSELK